MTHEQKMWLMDLIESMVSNPERANFGTRKGYFDLEIILDVDPDDEAIFTDAVLEDLIAQVAKKTGVFLPVIYLDNKPNAKAQEQLAYAYNKL